MKANPTAKTKKIEGKDKQLLHLVFGGELESVDDVTFKDLAKLDVVGFFPNYESAHRAWLSKARETIDNAQMRYFITHLHRLLDHD
jgi:cAMP phosphodiesterase